MAARSGEHVFVDLPALNADNFQIFLDPFAQAFADSLNILLLDKSGAHTTVRLRWPENVRYVLLPPYCRELNPIERLWRDLKDDLAWLQFTDLATQQQSVGDVLRASDLATLQSLTSYGSLVKAINALSP